MKTILTVLICAFSATLCHGQNGQACRAQGPPLQETMKYVLKQAQLKDLAFNDKNGTLFYEGAGITELPW